MSESEESRNCDLCGVPLGGGAFALPGPEQTPLRFCCTGCRMVWTVLSEAGGADSTGFRNTALFRECQERGIIPRASAPPPQPVSPAEADPSAPPCAGFLQLNLSLSGMWCPACAWVIEHVLKREAGILSASCDFALDRLHCRYDPTRTSPGEIARVVARLGYRVVETAAGARERLERREFVRLAVSAFLAANAMMLSLALYSGFFTHLEPDQVRVLSLPILLLAAIVLIYGGGPLFRRAMAGIVEGAPGMEALIGLAALSAYGYSLFSFLSGSLHLYADTAAMLIVLVLLGKLLETRARNRAHDLLKGTIPLRPAKARRLTPDFPRGRYVPAGMLRPGDRLRVAAGESIPADGPIVAGSALLDEASLTGEAAPVPRGTGDFVTSGAWVRHGEIDLRAERVGADATIGRMAEMVERALAEKSRAEGQTDRLLRLFVPVVIVLATATAATLLLIGQSVPQALLRGVTVLLISCPCALGLAVPLARVAGIALAGRAGMLARDFSPFEAARGIDTVAFDKTGTITDGHWQLLAVTPFGPLSAEKLVAWAAGLEGENEHPVAHAVHAAARQRSLAPSAVSQRECHPTGIAGLIDGQAVRIGNAAFALCGEEPPPSDPPEADIHSTVWMSAGGHLAGRLIFGDGLKQGAVPAVLRLKAMGCRVLLLSGDDPATVQAAARAAGIESAHGALSPEAKEQIIRELRRKGARVAMVGDGINDAPALAAADLGLAMSACGAPAFVGAEVVLMGGAPGQVPRFLELSLKVRRRILATLLFSALYNLVSIPVAMAGWLSPLVAVSAMLLSSLSVTLSTLSLLREAVVLDKRRSAL